MNLAHRRWQITAVALLWALFAATPAHAQGNLLDQGKDLLQQFGVGTGGPAGGLSTAEITNGLKEALKIGTRRVSSRLGRVDGFNKNPDIHIPLPGSLATAQKTLSRFGLGGMGDDLELRLNRAAEAAVPRAKTLFWDAIADMSLDDARKILNGPDDAATRYFQGKMSAPLGASFRPIVDRELAAAGAVKAYDDMIGRYKALPMVPDAKAELTGYVVDKALGAVFLLLAREEKAIRENPAKRTTELLRKVFGS